MGAITHKKGEYDCGHGSTSEMAFYNQPPQTFLFSPLTSVTGTCLNKDKDEMEKANGLGSAGWWHTDQGNVFFSTEATQLY